MYHDLIADGLTVTRRPVALRTQTKNAARESEAQLFSSRHPHSFLRGGMRVGYTASQIQATESKTILEAMCSVTNTDFATADYRLPVPDAWTARMNEKIWQLGRPGQRSARANRLPWLVHRPLVYRPEWRGSGMRNADAVAYEGLFASIRDRFFVISVADLEPAKEWLTVPFTDADLILHKGELVFEELAALFKQADMVFTSSGFAAVLGPAVETATFSVVGGYESIGCHDTGARFAPYLAVGPIQECGCWTSACTRVCNKTVDMWAAIPALTTFVDRLA